MNKNPYRRPMDKRDSESRTPYSRQRERDEIQQQMDDFVKSGGVVAIIPPTEEIEGRNYVRVPATNVGATVYYVEDVSAAKARKRDRKLPVKKGK